MVIKKKNSVFSEQTPEIQLPKWMLTKWFLYLATAVVLVLFIGFSLPAGTRDNVANAIFAKTAIDGSGSVPSPLTPAEIAIANWPKKDDWKFTCVQKNAGGRCVSYSSDYIGKECYQWNTKGTICLTYEDGTKSNIPEPAPITGTATPTSTSRQETETININNEWYSIGDREYRKGGEAFQYNGIRITINVAPSKFDYAGSTNVMVPSDEDRQKLQNSEQNIIIKMKFRIKGTGEIFETHTTDYGSSIMFDAMPGWQSALGERGKNLQPVDIEWQPEFGVNKKYND